MEFSTTTIPYTIDGAPFEGVFVRAPDQRIVPLVLMAPDWLGVGEGAKAMARTIAAMGAAVFVADLYGTGRRPTTPDEAMAHAGPLKADMPEVRKRIHAALATMRKTAPDLVSRQAAIGFCFGGMNVLELARSGADLALFVSIHGDLVTTHPAGPGAIKGEVIVLHGAADPISPKTQRDAFEAEMEAAGATWFCTTFGKAVHSFTDPHAAVPGVAHYDAFASDWSMAIVAKALEA